MTAASEHQLGDFIKGRLLFIEDYCRRTGLDYARTLKSVEAEALRLAGDEERRSFLRSRLFGGGILASSYLPDWLDRVFLEATTHALKGVGAPTHTKTSKVPCIPFEAGRFNAHRQSETVFRLLFGTKKPEEWLKHTFPVIYRKCYGDVASGNLSVEELGPGKFRISMDNRSLEKASPMDCSTTIGYLFGAMEKLGAHEILVTHTACGAGQGDRGGLCVFEVAWK